MHSFVQDYASLMIGTVAILGLFLSGLVSSNRDRARRAKQADLQAPAHEHRETPFQH